MQSEGGIIYTEVHYVPHYFMPESFHNASAGHTKQHSRYNKEISVRDIVEAINTGLDMGQREFRVAAPQRLVSRPNQTAMVATYS